MTDWGVPTGMPTLISCKPGYCFWMLMSCSVTISGVPISHEPPSTASSSVGSPAVYTRSGSPSASIWSSVKPRTKPSGANIFMFSSKNERVSRMPCCADSAR